MRVAAASMTIASLVLVALACGNGPVTPPTSPGSETDGGGTVPIYPLGTAGVVTGSSAIVAGLFFTCVLLAGGTVKCWGFNEYGMLGDNTLTDSITPVDVTNLSGALAIGAGGYDVCALMPDTTIQCWGDNFGGQLGETTLQNSDVPVAVPTVTDAVQIAVGDDLGCALRSNRTAQCWGGNTDGEVGSGVLGGNPYFQAAPSVVLGLVSASAIVSGTGHSCALVLDGSLYCWGENSDGQLGTGTTSDNASIPVPVTGLKNVIAVSAGTLSTCALTNDGAVWCWGANTYGELGTGSTTPALSTTPIKVPTITGATAISVGDEYACAILSDRTVVCWGKNEEGNLGNGTIVDSATPVQVSSLTNVTGISTASDHACADLADGTFACWGDNQSGQLGDGTTTQSSTPVAVKL